MWTPIKGLNPHGSYQGRLLKDYNSVGIHGSMCHGQKQVKEEGPGRACIAYRGLQS